MRQTSSRPLLLAHIDAQRLWPSLAAVLLGAFLVIGAGFSHSQTLHNAAHDSRHSAAFPCH
jgi:cobalt transporter subunit CbtB